MQLPFLCVVPKTDPLHACTAVQFFVDLSTQAKGDVLQLVVETEFSGGCCCVWVDPVLLLHPVPPNTMHELASSAAADSTPGSAARTLSAHCQVESGAGAKADTGGTLGAGLPGAAKQTCLTGSLDGAGMGWAGTASSVAIGIEGGAVMAAQGDGRSAASIPLASLGEVEADLPRVRFVSHAKGGVVSMVPCCSVPPATVSMCCMGCCMGVAGQASEQVEGCILGGSSLGRVCPADFVHQAVHGWSSRVEGKG